MELCVDSYMEQCVDSYLEQCVDSYLEQCVLKCRMGLMAVHLKYVLMNHFWLASCYAL